MSSSRPRRAASAPPSLKPSVRRGLESLCESKAAAATVRSMLSAAAPGEALVDSLSAVMGVSGLNAEMLLASYFDAGLLGTYCERRLGKSAKGSAATLAARIAREWEKPDFQPLGGGEAKAAAGEKAKAAASETPKQPEKSVGEKAKSAAVEAPPLPEKLDGEKAKAAAVEAPSLPENDDDQKAKRQKTEEASVAAASASALTTAAFIPDDQEPMVSFDAAHYGELGLNGKFMQDGAVDCFAGGEQGGGGLFEDAEKRDIARPQTTAALLAVCRQHGLQPGATILDVGAGTGLMLQPFAAEVGETGRVLAVDLSPKFVGLMRRRFADHPRVSVSKCSARALELPEAANGSVDVAIIIDVYHHFEYPRSTMRSLAASMRKGGRVIVVDFHRDPAKMAFHEPKWAIEHIRADQATFRREIEESGFELLEEPVLPELLENYVMVFGLRDAIAKECGASE